MMNGYSVAANSISCEFVKEVIDEAEESIKDRLPSESGLGEAIDILEQK